MTFTGTSGNLRYFHLLPGYSIQSSEVWHRSVALYLASLVEVGRGRTLSRVEITVIAWGVNILSGVINTIGTKAIGSMSSFNLWWTLGGTLVLVITLLVKTPDKVPRLSEDQPARTNSITPQNSAAFVFTDFEKCGNFLTMMSEFRPDYSHFQLHGLGIARVCRVAWVFAGT